jgi:hypothetical protein
MIMDRQALKILLETNNEIDNEGVCILTLTLTLTRTQRFINYYHGDESDMM